MVESETWKSTDGALVKSSGIYIFMEETWGYRQGFYIWFFKYL